MLKKFGQMWNGMMSSSTVGNACEDQDAIDGVVNEERIISLREKLNFAIRDNNDFSDILREIVEIELENFAKKYAMLDVVSLLSLNNQSVESLQRIVAGLSLLVRYAQHLLKTQDQDKYKSIPLSNNHVQTKLLPMNGSTDIMGLLGYTEQTNSNFRFPPNTEPDCYVIVNLLADMLLFKAEMRYYLSGSHIASHQISALLPPSTLAKLKNYNEGAGQESLNASMQSLVLDNSKDQNSNSNETGPYYSAQSALSNKDSPEVYKVQEALPEVERETITSEATLFEGKSSDSVTSHQERPGQVVTMQDFDVQVTRESETSSLKSSSLKIPCSLCNEEAQLMCKPCTNKLLCENCASDWHSHPSRREHVVERIADMNPETIHQDTIVEGPYGIIAQAQNPAAAMISKKMQAAVSSLSDKSKRSVDAYDREGVADDAGNMPDFGSIMSGNVETVPEDRNKASHSQQQQSNAPRPKLLSRGGSEDKKVHKDWDQNVGSAPRGYGPPPQQQHRYPLDPQQMQQHLPQFLRGEDNDVAAFGNRQQALHHHHQLQQQNRPLSPPSQFQNPSPSMPHSVQSQTPSPVNFQGPQSMQAGQFYHGPPLTPASYAPDRPVFVHDQPSNYNQGQHVQLASQFQGLPLHVQMPPASLYQSFQSPRQGVSTPQMRSPDQYYYSPPMQQQQYPFFRPQVPPHSYQSAPSSAHSGGGGDDFSEQYYQYRPPRFSVHDGSKNIASTRYSTSTYNANPVRTTNSWNVDRGGNQHQNPAHNSSDKEETFVQYPKGFHTMDGQAYSAMDPSNMHPQSKMPLAQTYPQLAPVPNVDGRQHQQADKPNREMHQSFSTPLLIQQFNSEKKSMYTAHIKAFNTSMQKIQDEIDGLLVEDADQSQINQKISEKKILLKKRKESEKLLEEISDPAGDSLEVHYPPSTVSNSNQGQQQSPVVSSFEKTKSGIRRSPSKQMPEPYVETSSLPVQSVQTRSDVPGKQQQPLPASALSLNVPAVESIIDNAQQSGPPQTSLKEDNSTPKSGNNNPPPILKWQCVHCTFLNEVSMHVCEICDKTTDKKKYTTDDGHTVLTESESESQAARSGQTKDFVCEKKSTNRIQFMQREEELMMAEKQKAKEDFLKKSPSSPIPGKKQSPKGSASDDDKTKATPSVIGEGAGGEQTAAEASGFSELAGRADAGSTMANATASLSASLALERLKEAKACDSMKEEGRLLIRFMKEADKAGYPVDAVPIALSFYDQRKSSVTGWLDKHWEKNMQKIMNEVDHIAVGREQNDIGQLSMFEAQAACIECKGNLKNAVDVCVRKREELFKHLNDIDSYAREEILQVMFTQQGNREKAEQELIRHKLEGFVERIWNKGESMKNILYPAEQVMTGSVNFEKCDSISSSALEQDAFQRLVTDPNVDLDRRIRMIMVESKLKSWGRGQIVIELLDKWNLSQHVSLEDVVEAVRNCRDRANALVFLQQECQICYDNFPMRKICNLNFCGCVVCVDCMKGHFTVVIKEKHVRNWTCAVCSLPDMNDEERCNDYLHMLQLQLTPMVTPDLLNLFEDKVRDFSLQKDPSFRWCAHCGNGFLADNVANNAMTCNACHKKTCFTCKRMWEDAHIGLTCEQFEQWKIDNDPNNQAIGLARHLEENGIDCPMCNMRYSLAKGGCMHFKCPQCGHEFCSGCYENFNHKGICKKYKNCDTIGLHCHHPRDCFSYLRDRNVKELQNLLTTNKVEFNTKVPEDQEDKDHCPVMEQREEGILKKDEKCGKDVDHEMAGLCQSHYKEYLTGLINKHALDPVQLMKVLEMVVLLQRYDMNVPARQETEAENAYKGKLLQIIKEKLPLKRKKLVE